MNLSIMFDGNHISGGEKGKKLLAYLLLSFFLFGDACIEPYDLDLSELSPRLVVDGELSNLPGPYEVKLYYTTRLDVSLSKPEYISGASMWIVDNENYAEPLSETEPGIYRTHQSSLFQGEVGKSYYLKIITPEGKEIRSVTQELAEVPEIEEVILEFEENYYQVDIPNKPPNRGVVLVYVKPKQVVRSTDLVRWRSHGTFKVFTHPELEYETSLTGSKIPTPLPCSGYVPNGDPWPEGVVQIRECECCTCWSEDFSTHVYMADDLPGNTQNPERIEVAIIPATSLYFHEKYFLDVEQMKLSPSVYAFWKLVKAQQRSSGSIFQPNAIKVRGNLRFVEDPDQEVLGVFSVASIDKKSRFIYPSDIPFALPPEDTIILDCRFIPFATTERPDFW